MDIPLPDDLQQAQNKINDYKKEQLLKNQIGKCYTTIEPHDRNYRIMRRVYLADDRYSHIQKIRVDEFIFNELDFTFKTWDITSAMTLSLEGYNMLNEMKPTNFYAVLKQKMNRLDVLKEFFIEEKIESH